MANAATSRSQRRLDLTLPFEGWPLPPRPKMGMRLFVQATPLSLRVEAYGRFHVVTRDTVNRWFTNLTLSLFRVAKKFLDATTFA